MSTWFRSELWRREAFWLGGLTIVFALSRLAVWLAGVPFETGTLSSAWQLLDPQLLQFDLARSLFYLHSQPPLFNLYVGAVLQLGPAEPNWIFLAINRLLGLTVCLGSYLLMRYLRISRPLAAAAAAVLVLRIGFLFDEQKIFYDLPTIALVLLAMLSLSRALEGCPWSFSFFLTSLFLLCALRSLFHLLFFLLAWLLCWMAGYPQLRHKTPALVLLTLLLGIYGKNYLVFGQFGVSSWLGLNLARVVTKGYSEEERSRRIAAGEMAEILRQRPFLPVTAYPDPLMEKLRWPEIPALAAKLKSTGEPNYNHEAVLTLGRLYLEASRREIASRPGLYLAEVGRNWVRMLEPNTGGRDLKSYRARLEPWVDVDLLEWALGLRPGVEIVGIQVPSPWRLTLFVWPLTLLLGLWWLVGRTPKAFQLQASHRFLLQMMLFVILWVALVGNSLEVGENARFRTYTDPLMTVIVCLLIERGRVALSSDPKRWAEAGVHRE